MARPKLGAAAKSATIAVRVTNRERDILTARYGSPTKALRALIASVTVPDTPTEDER